LAEESTVTTHGVSDLEQLIPLFRPFLDDEPVSSFVFNAFEVGHLRQTEVFGDLRAYLGRVAVDSLTTGNYQVELQHAESTGDSVRSRQRIGTGELRSLR